MTTDEEDAVIAQLSDYLDGATANRAEIAANIASDPDWKRLHDEMVDSSDDVTGTIEKRSAGRFFGRRTLGDRVPFGLLLVLALIVLGAIGYVLWSSPTGSLAGERAAPEHAGSAQIVPAP